MRVNRSEAGMSMVETMMAMLVFAAASVGFYQVLIGQAKSSDTVRSVSKISDSARLGFDRMTRDVREADGISATTSTGTTATFTINVNYNGDSLYQNPNSAGDNEILTYAYDSTAQTISLNGEVLMTGVTPIGSTPIFSYSSNILDYDWNNDGTTTWQELDAAGANGVVGVGDGNSVLSAGEWPYLTTIDFAVKGADKNRTTDFYAKVTMRNRV